MEEFLSAVEKNPKGVLIFLIVLVTIAAIPKVIVSILGYRLIRSGIPKEFKSVKYFGVVISKEGDTKVETQEEQKKELSDDESDGKVLNLKEFFQKAIK